MDRRVKERLIGASILVVLVVLIVPELLSGPKRPAASVVPLIPVASGATEAVRSVTVDLATSKATAEDFAGASAAGDPAAGVPAAAERQTPATGAVVAATPAAASPSITTLKAQQANPAAGGDPAAGVPTAREPVPTSPAARAPAAGGAAAAAVAAAAAGAGAATAAATRTAASTVTAAQTEPARHGWAVQLGSFASKANAEALVRRLKADKVPAYVSSSGSGRFLRYRVRVGPLADRDAAERTIVRLKKAGRGALVPP